MKGSEKMEYKKIEHEIDRLLEKGDLNFYERKLLRKIKRRFAYVNERFKEDTKFILFQHETIGMGKQAVDACDALLKHEKKRQPFYFLRYVAETVLRRTRDSLSNGFVSFEARCSFGRSDNSESALSERDS